MKSLQSLTLWQYSFMKSSQCGVCLYARVCIHSCMLSCMFIVWTVADILSVLALSLNLLFLEAIILLPDGFQGSVTLSKPLL